MRFMRVHLRRTIRMIWECNFLLHLFTLKMTYFYDLADSYMYRCTYRCVHQECLSIVIARACVGVLMHVCNNLHSTTVPGSTRYEGRARRNRAKRAHRSEGRLCIIVIIEPTMYIIMYCKSCGSGMLCRVKDIAK